LGSVKEPGTSGVPGSYEEAFKEISTATGIHSLDELVSSFIKVEDSNFEIFNRINVLSAECEKLEQHVAEVKGEVNKCKGNGLNADNQRKKTLKELEDILKAMEAQSEVYEKKCEAAAKTVRGQRSNNQPLRLPLAYLAQAATHPAASCFHPLVHLALQHESLPRGMSVLQEAA
jgi:hypothetical protein